MQAFFASSAGANRLDTPADIAVSVSWKCAGGGEASPNGFALNADSGNTAASVNQSFTIEYTICGGSKSAAGVAVYGGSFTVPQSVITGAVNGASVDQTFKGRIEGQGAFNNFATRARYATGNHRGVICGARRHRLKEKKKEAGNGSEGQDAGVGEAESLGPLCRVPPAPPR